MVVPRGRREAFQSVGVIGEQFDHQLTQRNIADVRFGDRTQLVEQLFRVVTGTVVELGGVETFGCVIVDHLANRIEINLRPVLRYVTPDSAKTLKTPCFIA